MSDRLVREVHYDLYDALRQHTEERVELVYPRRYKKPDQGFVEDLSIYKEVIGWVAEFRSSAAMLVFLLSARSVIIKWMELRGGRTLTLRKGDISIEIKGKNDIDKLVTALKSMEASSEGEKKTPEGLADHAALAALSKSMHRWSVFSWLLSPYRMIRSRVRKRRP